jgi:glycine/D-amino acid oxidase-like deaminating enzyme
VDAIVVGGGILGCCAGLQLRRAGLEVVICERDGVGAATSSAGAGFVGAWAAGWIPTFGAEELELERFGLAFYDELARAGHELGYRQNGNLYAAASDEAWAAFVEPIAANTDAVPDVRRLTAAEAEAATAGVLAADAIVGAALHPSGAQVSAPRAAHAVAAEYLDEGGMLETRLPVRSLLVRGGRVAGVETTRETIEAPVVVLAAGAWSNQLLREHGVWLPCVPLVASRVVTEPLGLPPTIPTIMMRDRRIYAREEEGGLLWGTGFEAPPRFAFADNDPPERFDSLSLDGFFEMRRVADDAVDAIPLLNVARSAAVSFGAPTYTADNRPLLGPVPALEGLLALVGCNEAGITHGPGFGKLIAELVVDGHARLCEVDAFRVDRFGPGVGSGRDIAKALGRARADAAGGTTNEVWERGWAAAR